MIMWVCTTCETGLRPFVLLSVGKLLIDVNKKVEMDTIVKENPQVKLGGFFTPPDCQPRDKASTNFCLLL